MLNDRVKVPVSKWFAAGLDLALAVAFVVALARVRAFWKRTAVLGFFVVPLVLAYFLFVTLQYSLDFALPLVLLLVHFGVEVTREIGRREALEEVMST